MRLALAIGMLAWLAPASARRKHKTVFKPRRFDPNVTLRREREPDNQTWASLCAERRTMNGEARRSVALLHALADGAVDVKLAKAFARRLARGLGERSVLCDSAHPCNVTLSPNHSSVTVCLPLASTPRERRAVVCEPYGEAWQQLGGEVSLFTTNRTRFKMLTNTLDHVYTGKTADAFGVPACASFDLMLLARWWRALRLRQPFIPASLPARPTSPTSLELEAALTQTLARKMWDARLNAGAPPLERRHKIATDRSYVQRYASWLSDSPSSRLARTFRPQQYRTCAVVGSGHDLNCGEARGAQIDAHDAVFRSNAAQHIGDLRGVTERQAAELHTKYSIDPARAGTRTSFRVNCIYGGSVPLPNASGGETEICIVPQHWFAQRWGREVASSTRHVCCDEVLVRSSYNMSRLQQLEEEGARFAFHVGIASGDESADAMLAGSGGNALQAALALCQSVDLYGAGLHSAGVGFNKVYAHAYDEVVGKCQEPGSSPYRFGKVKGMLGFFQWRKDRVRTEILLHILHALHVIRWVQ